MKEVREGKVKLEVPSGRKYDADVFYNDDAILQRDISVAVVYELSNEISSVCDSLSATGVRGLRYAKESSIKNVTLCDNNEKAFEIIKRNIKSNNLQDYCRPVLDNSREFLAKNKFDFVDIDPFGPPVYFLDATAKSAQKFAAITATDTSALCGTYPKACFNKYGIHPIHLPDYYAEMGLRILISKIMFSFARENKGFVPILSHSKTHYFRVYGKIENDPKTVMRKFAHIMHCHNCGNRKTGHVEEMCGLCKKPFEISDPVYMGPIHDSGFVRRVIGRLSESDFKQKNSEIDMLHKISEEIDRPLYYNMDYIAKKQKIKIPKLNIVMERLEEDGFRVSRTHFSNSSIKTGASFKKIISLI